MKYVSYAAAVETLKGFFREHPNTDIISLNDIFRAANRDLNRPVLNKSWISNKLVDLKHYQLVSPVYTHGRRKVLDKIQLTQEGKKALGLDLAESARGEAQRMVTLELINSNIREFEKSNPSVELELVVKIKKMP